MYHKHTLMCTVESKSALCLFMCNSRVTQQSWTNVPWNPVSWEPAWTCPSAPVSAPTTCALSHIHVDASLSTLVCMQAVVCTFFSATLHICMQTHAFSSAHIHSLSLIHVCAHTQTFLKAPVFRRILFIGPAWL